MFCRSLLYSAILQVKSFVHAFLLCALLAPAAVWAASDGSVGTTSSGTSSVSVTVPELVRISGMADIAFGTWSGSGNLDDDEDVCVYTNKAAGTYFVTASGSGGSGAFTLSDGASGTLAYEVYFNDATGTSGEVQLTAATKSAQQSGANTSSTTCGGSDTANYHVRILSSALSGAAPASYTGTLTILIEPN